MYALDADNNSEARNALNVNSYPTFFRVSETGKLDNININDRSEDGILKLIKTVTKKSKKRSRSKSKSKSKKKTAKRRKLNKKKSLKKK